MASPPPPRLVPRWAGTQEANISPCKPQSRGKGHQVNKEIPAAKATGWAVQKTGLCRTQEESSAALFTTDCLTGYHPTVIPFAFPGSSSESLT